MGTSATPRSDFRPDYWDPADPLTALIGNVKGAKRRELIKARASGCSMQVAVNPEVYSLLSEEELLADELEDPGTLGRIHPHYLGGEFLPAYEPDEVEIARITLASTTMDVIAIRARRAHSLIRYRVVDEYETEFSFRPRSSKKPHTLQQLIRLIDSISTEESDSYLESLRDGCSLTVSSPFYPELEAHYQEPMAEKAACHAPVAQRQELSDRQSAIIQSLADLGATTQILIDYLSVSDQEKAHEAVSVLMMQGVTAFGLDSVPMQNFFPVFDEIKRRIDASNFQGAIKQTRVFQRQLEEVMEIVRNAE